MEAKKKRELLWLSVITCSRASCLYYMQFSGSSASNIVATPVKTWIKHKELKALKKQQLGNIG